MSHFVTLFFEGFGVGLIPACLFYFLITAVRGMTDITADLAA